MKSVYLISPNKKDLSDISQVSIEDSNSEVSSIEDIDLLKLKL